MIFLVTYDREPKCRVCGVGLHIGHMPDPLLPGDLPAPDELCGSCSTGFKLDEFVDEELALGPRDDYMDFMRYDRCPRCESAWHGLPWRNCPSSLDQEQAR